MLLDSYSSEAARLYHLGFFFIFTNILIFLHFQDYFSDVEGHYLCIYDSGPVYNMSLFTDVLAAGGTTRLYTSAIS